MEIVRFIADHLNDKNPAMNDGTTPLHLAAEEGHLDIVKFIGDLLENKNPSDNLENTPQSLAEKNGHTDIVGYFKNKFSLLDL